jgi:hypothetical protein
MESEARDLMKRRIARALYLTGYQERVAGGGGLQARAYAAWLAAAIFNTVGSFYLPRPALCPNEAGGASGLLSCPVRQSGGKFILPTNSPI